MRVADLGEARGLAVDATMTAVGTPHWCAPEVLRGDHAYDEKCDVYSYGVVLFELAARGQRPYAGLSPPAVLLAVLDGSLRPAMPADAPPRVAALAATCWAHDPRARPSFSQVLADLMLREHSSRQS